MIGRPSLSIILAYYIVLGTFFYAFTVYGQKHVRAIRIFVLLFILFISYLVLDNRASNELEVVFLDVGQGEAIVIIKNNETYIIDGGGHRLHEIGRSTGSNILIPFLEYRGISTINTVFVTHEDADHMLGIVELIGQKNINKIYTTIGLNTNYHLSQELINRAYDHNIPIEFISAGRQFLSESGIHLEVLYPFYGTFFRTINSTSIVLRLTYNNVSFLFTADIDQISELDLIGSGANIQAHVLNVSHHGSRFSSNPYFIDAVAPVVAVVSAGVGNQFSHPAPCVVNEFYIRNIPLYNTMYNGTITIKTNGNRLSINTSK